MGKYTFKKGSAKIIRQMVMRGDRVSIDIGKDFWCDIVSSSLAYEDQPKIIFTMAGGNKPEKATLDYEYRYRVN